MSEAIGRLIGLALTLFIGIFALGGVKLSAEKRRFDLAKREAQDEAVSAKEKIHEQIKNTDARELVAADPDPAARSAERDAIVNGFRQRLRDRTRSIVSGHDGT